MEDFRYSEMLGQFEKEKGSGMIILFLGKWGHFRPFLNSGGESREGKHFYEVGTVLWKLTSCSDECVLSVCVC